MRIVQARREGVQCDVRVQIRQRRIAQVLHFREIKAHQPQAIQAHQPQAIEGETHQPQAIEGEAPQTNIQAHKPQTVQREQRKGVRVCQKNSQTHLQEVIAFLVRTLFF